MFDEVCACYSTNKVVIKREGDHWSVAKNIQRFEQAITYGEMIKKELEIAEVGSEHSQKAAFEESHAHQRYRRII